MRACHAIHETRHVYINVSSYRPSRHQAGMLGWHIYIKVSRHHPGGRHAWKPGWHVYIKASSPPPWTPRGDSDPTCLYKLLKLPPRWTPRGGIPGWHVYINCSTSNRRRRRIMSAPSRTGRMCDEANSYPALLEKSVIFLHQRRSLS